MTRRRRRRRRMTRRRRRCLTWPCTSAGMMSAIWPPTPPSKDSRKSSSDPLALRALRGRALAGAEEVQGVEEEEGGPVGTPGVEEE